MRFSARAHTHKYNSSTWVHQTKCMYVEEMKECKLIPRRARRCDRKYEIFPIQICAWMKSVNQQAASKQTNNQNEEWTEWNWSWCKSGWQGEQKIDRQGDYKSLCANCAEKIVLNKVIESNRNLISFKGIIT